MSVSAIVRKNLKPDILSVLNIAPDAAIHMQASKDDHFSHVMDKQTKVDFRAAHVSPAQTSTSKQEKTCDVEKKNQDSTSSETQNNQSDNAVLSHAASSEQTTSQKKESSSDDQDTQASAAASVDDQQSSDAENVSVSALPLEMLLTTSFTQSSVIETQTPTDQDSDSGQMLEGTNAATLSPLSFTDETTSVATTDSLAADAKTNTPVWQVALTPVLQVQDSSVEEMPVQELPTVDHNKSPEKTDKKASDDTAPVLVDQNLPQQSTAHAVVTAVPFVVTSGDKKSLPGSFQNSSHQETSSINPLTTANMKGTELVTAKVAGVKQAVVTRVNEAMVRAITQQVREAFGGTIHEGKNKIDVQLSPPSWGKIQVRVHVENSELHVSILTEHPFVKEALDRGLHNLRQIFLQDGSMKLGNLQVGVGDQYASQTNKGESEMGHGMYPEEISLEENVPQTPWRDLRASFLDKRI